MEYTDMKYTLEDFLNCLETGKTPETTLEDNIHSYQMVTACIKSGEIGEWVAL
jgi:predicted dehydrogenase